MEEKLLFLNRSDVRSCLSPAQVIGTVEDLWKHWRDGAVIEGQRSFLQAGLNPQNEFLHMPVCLPGLGVLGFKWINCYMEPAPGYPFTHGSLIVLNDIATGSPLALVNATDITAMRTAGGHGVAAARLLAKKTVRQLSVIGSGLQAENGIAGFLCAFPELERVRVWCRKGEAFARLERRFGGQVRMEHAEDCRMIGRGADVILAATSSPDVLLWYGDLEKGTTVIALDGFIDVDPALAGLADKWYVGSRETDCREIIDSGVMSHGVKLNRKDIFGELPDVACGRTPGREREDEIIVCTHMGSGAYDIACAWAVYRQARAEGIGLELTL